MTPFSTADALAIATLLRETAQAEILPHFRNLADDAVRTKSGPLDLVTVADEAAERVITAGLLARFPGCVVVGEEATAADPSLLGRLAEADLAFVVDPIDGTANFAAGLPLFGSMVAAMRRGEIFAGIILDPIGDDSAIALRGEGAWMEAADGKRRDLHVAAPVPVSQMSGGATWRNLPGGVGPRVAVNLGRVAASWDFRCAAHHYRVLAAGSCHYLLFCKLMPWDHAPGWLLHQEAGGYSARLDRSPYRPTVTDGGLLCAPDESSWEALRAALLDA